MSSPYITLYSAVLLLSLNGLFVNGIPLDASTMVHIRSVFAGLTLLLFITMTRGSFHIGNLRSITMVYLIGILMGIHWLTFFYAMQSASVAIGMLALYTFPIMTVLMEPIFNGKKRQIIDLVLGCIILISLGIIVGGSLLNQPSNDSTNTIHDHTPIIYGVISGVLSAMAFSLRNLLQKYHCTHLKSDTLMIHQVLVITLITIALTDYISLTQLHTADWLYLLALGIITTAIAHTLLVKSYQLLAAKTVAMISCLQPVLGSILAWSILNEALPLSTILGGSIILGVAVYESTKANA